MIKKHYTGLQRRAENIIWNAAGRYDFDPPFMAFMENGEPDLYFNMIIGLCCKWFSMERLTRFFASYEGFRKAEEFDAILWLGLENCVYEKEVGERPMMAQLRRRRAEWFYKTRQTLSRQQMMLQSMPVFDQQDARWSKVLGKRESSLTPKEKKLSAALELPGGLDTEGVIRAMTLILQEYFHFDPETYHTGSAGKRRDGGGAHMLRHLLHHETQVHDSLVVRNGTGEGDLAGSAQLTRGAADQKSARNAEEDLAYIQAVFGKCVVPEADLRQMENNLCVGAHASMRLYVAGGSPLESGPGLAGRDARDLERLRHDWSAQAQRNEAWLMERGTFLHSGIRSLSARIDEILSSAERALPEEGRSGTLEPEKAYRLPVLQDPEVFSHPGDETERSVCVDLLLDASASRLNYQEQLAAEACMVARSFMACGVPVQVEAFRSLRGFLVLQVLKGWKSHDCSKILHYTAGGWNRDGLGLRLAGELMLDRNAERLRILLVLTDASPNDSTRIPEKGSSLLTREYQGREAVLDTKQAVEDLRAQGIRVAAVFLGPTLYLENLHTIYGQSCVRIHRIEQMEEAAAGLLELILRQEKK